MINLLPESGRWAFRRAYHARLLVIALSGALAVIMISIAFILPTFFSTRARRQAVSHELEIALARPVSKEADALAEEVRRVNSKIKLLAHEESEGQTFTWVTDRILGKAAASIAITQIALGKDKVVVVHGIAGTRTALLAFIAALNEDEQFSEVISPISNLIDNVDVAFSVNLKIK